ncbi:MAG: rhomboid family intramembrane serine protease [Pseudomonadota bacterium]|uniref:Rhomboid family intramembrane serine protease n=1 Tax=Candidatus Desulfatibia profunda TaxID=2841695 RepID=A0A8J6NYV0_9BACT|nr:rhomboid family intramembrane serine protease [Candidatus Desulfatibia profunda]MBL7180642.1 rhomboid family intramembrane serine protease [Desulfobacterales bacterium]
MIPIRDTIPSKNYPVVNNTIIGINVVIFLVELAQGSGLDRFIYIYGLVPARYSVPQISSYFNMFQQVFSILSFMFLHGGFWHLLGNMWSLYIFGDNVEDRLGSLRYLLFYLLCGLTSGLTHLIFNLHSNIPTIGASGAIAGVMGAYLILYPHSKILTLIPIIFIPWFVEIPAFFFLGFWFVLQFINAAGTRAGAAGIAWWAHIGGFVFGILFLKMFFALPATGISDQLRRVTAKRKTDRLQVIRPVGPGSDHHLYGTIAITSFEALAGTSKLVNIPWGFQKRLVRVVVPPGIKEGGNLRLKGLGKIMPDGQRGDLYLRVAILA